jgi:hypothetical protein
MEEERKPAGVRPSGRGRERSSVIWSAAPRKASARSEGRSDARSQTIQGKERSWEREREDIDEKATEAAQKRQKEAYQLSADRKPESTAEKQP